MFLDLFWERLALTQGGAALGIRVEFAHQVQIYSWIEADHE